MAVAVSSHCITHFDSWRRRVPLDWRPLTAKVEYRKQAVVHCKVDCAAPNFSYGKMLSEISSWGIGGPAKMFVEVKTATEMASVLRFAYSCYRTVVDVMLW